MKTTKFRFIIVAFALVAMLASCTKEDNVRPISQDNGNSWPNSGRLQKISKTILSMINNLYDFHTDATKLEDWTSYTYIFNPDRSDWIYITAHGIDGSFGDMKDWKFEWNDGKLGKINYKDINHTCNYEFSYGNGPRHTYTKYDTVCHSYDDQEHFHESHYNFYKMDQRTALLTEWVDGVDELEILYIINFDDNGEIVSITNWATTYYFKWQNGNVVEITTDNSKTYGDWKYTYDNNESSFASIDPLLLIGIVDIEQLPNFLSKNNIVSIETNNVASNYNYTYGEGYPQTRIMNSTTDYFKYINSPGTAPTFYRVSSNTSGDGYYANGALVRLDARYYSYDPSDTHFTEWDDGCTDPIRVFTVTCDTTFVAHYANGYIR